MGMGRKKMGLTVERQSVYFRQMKTTTISDLKQHLSARLKTVRAGEPLLVTDRRVPVAMLAPLSPDVREAGLAGLVSNGVLAPPSRPLDVGRFRSMPRGKWASGLSSAVIEERDNR